jgi:hypothetical protein
MDALPIIRRAVSREADRSDIVQELTIHIMRYPPTDPNPWARKSYVGLLANTVIARQFRLRTGQAGPDVVTEPYLLEIFGGEQPGDESAEPAAEVGHQDELIDELHKRLSSLRATVDTCPVGSHRRECPETVLQSVTDALTLAASRLDIEPDSKGGGRSVLDIPRRKLREDEVRRRIGERGCNKKAAEKWVERVILPCFDWRIYRTLEGLDGFDEVRYERVHKDKEEVWGNPLPHEWLAAQEIIEAVQPHRWMVLRHIKLVNGRWDPEKYGVKRMRVLLAEHHDLEVIMRIHMPAVANVLGLGKEG